MKTFGSVLLFTRQRNEALLAAYRRLASRSGFIRLKDIGRQIADSPSPRFWVSEERAAFVVSAIMRGKPILRSMRPSKREMFIEIHRRVVELKKKCPDWPLNRLVAEVIDSPAPKFYMEPSSVIERLFKIRNGWYDNGKGNFSF